MLKVREETKILAWLSPVDMRKSFNGLIAVTQSLLKEDPYSDTIFLFHNKQRNYVKLLFWDRTGYVLYAKCLERGKFKIELRGEKHFISKQQLTLLLDGIPLGIRRKVLKHRTQSESSYELPSSILVSSIG